MKTNREAYPHWHEQSAPLHEFHNQINIIILYEKNIN